MPEVQKQGRPNDKKPDEWQQDLNPNPMAGQNIGIGGASAEKEAPIAYDLKEVHRYLEGYTADELKQIKVLSSGTRLQQGATYVDLKDAERKEFTAMGNMEASAENWYVPKSETSYDLWNRLTGVQNPDRLAESK